MSLAAVWSADGEAVIDFTLAIGLVGLMQVCVLPGALVYAGARFWRVAPSVPTIFAISLAFNYALVMLSVAAHVYSSLMVWTVIVAECLGIVYIFWRRGWLMQPLGATGPSQWFSKTVSRVAGFARAKPIAALVALALHIWALYVIGVTLQSAVKHSFDGFDTWDAVQSWDNWARELFRGEYAGNAYHYPQLLPANYSISYMLTGEPQLKIFSSSLDRFFFPMAAIALYWFAIKSERSVLLLAVPLADIITRQWLGEYRDQAYADMPVAFFCLLSLAIYIAPRSKNSQPMDSTLAIAAAAILAFGAAATKQAGLHWVVLLTAMMAIDMLRRQPFYVSAPKRDIAWTIGLLLLASLSWYAYVQFKIAIGQSGSEIPYVTGEIFEGVPPLQRLLKAISEISPLTTGSIALTVAIGLTQGRRIPAFGLTIGYLVIWGCFFSYDRRNSALALPTLALMTVMAVDWLVARGQALLASKATSRAPLFSVSSGNDTTPPPGGVPVLVLLAPALALIVGGGVYASSLTSEADLQRHQYLSEPELHGPAPDDYLREVARIVVDSPKGIRVWSRDRYTCVLTSTRVLADCKQLAGRNRAASSWLPNAQDLTDNIPVMEEELDHGGAVVLVLDDDETPPSIKGNIAFAKLKSYNHFSVWVAGNAPLPPAPANR